MIKDDGDQGEGERRKQYNGNSIDRGRHHGSLKHLNTGRISQGRSRLPFEYNTDVKRSFIRSAKKMMVSLSLIYAGAESKIQEVTYPSSCFPEGATVSML